MDEFAIVYESAARLGFLPRECDAMEIWELASALGANHADEPDDPLVDDAGLDWNARRATALAQGLPEPSWEDVPLSAQERAGLQKLMGGIDPILPPDVSPSP